VTEKRILFDGFEFPMIKGLEYLINENVPETDFLLINEPSTDFSLMFEKDFPIFKVPENLERDYCLFELKRSDRVIRFFCPEKHKNIDTAVWYFYIELFDERGEAHTLPGQVRVEFEGNVLRYAKGKPQFIEVLEQVKLTSAAVSA
jgi:hypothetical protein